MKTLLSLLLFCVLLPTAVAQGGGLSDLLRSVTGALGTKEAPPQSGQTTVLGIRGMDEGDAKAAAPVAGDAKQLESWAVERKEAETVAAKKGLTARPAKYE